MKVCVKKALSINTKLVNGSRTLNASHDSSGYSPFTSTQKTIMDLFSNAASSEESVFSSIRFCFPRTDKTADLK